MPGDEALDSQIVKDLHRTGNTGFTTEEEHGILKRVLLAYARYNKTTGYCQGFNILAALILKVVNFDEQLTLKVSRDALLSDIVIWFEVGRGIEHYYYGGRCTCV